MKQINAKETKVQTLSASHVIIYTEHPGGSEDTKHHLQNG